MLFVIDNHDATTTVCLRYIQKESSSPGFIVVKKNNKTNILWNTFFITKGCLVRAYIRDAVNNRRKHILSGSGVYDGCV